MIVRAWIHRYRETGPSLFGRVGNLDSSTVALGAVRVNWWKGCGESLTKCIMENVMQRIKEYWHCVEHNTKGSDFAFCAVDLEH